MKKFAKITTGLAVAAAVLCAASVYGAAGDLAQAAVSGNTVTISGTREELPDNGSSSYTRVLQYSLNGGGYQDASVSGGLKGSGTWSFTQSYPDATAPYKPNLQKLEQNDSQYQLSVSASDNGTVKKQLTYRIRETTDTLQYQWPCEHGETSRHIYNSTYGTYYICNDCGEPYWGDYKHLADNNYSVWCGPCRGFSKFRPLPGVRCFGTQSHDIQTATIWSKAVTVPEAVSGLKGYWIKTGASQTAPSPASIKTGGSFSTSSDFSFPVTTVKQYAYITAEDNAGNLSPPLTVELPGCSCTISGLTAGNAASYELRPEETDIPLLAAVEPSAPCDVPGHDSPAALSYRLISGSQNGSIEGSTLKVDKSGIFEIEVTVSLNLAPVQTKTFTISVQKCTCDDIDFVLSDTTVYKERAEASVSHTLEPQITTSCDIAAHNDLPITYAYAFTGNQDGASLKDGTVTTSQNGDVPIKATVTRNGFSKEKTVVVTTVECSCTIQSLTFDSFDYDLPHDQSDIALSAVAVSAESCGNPSHHGKQPVITFSLNGEQDGASVAGTVLTATKSGLYSVKATAELNGDVVEKVATVTVRKCICDTNEIVFEDLLLPQLHAGDTVSATLNAQIPNLKSCPYTGHNGAPSIQYALRSNPGGGTLEGNLFSATAAGDFEIEATAAINGIMISKTATIQVVLCTCSISELTVNNAASYELRHNETDIPLSVTAENLKTCPIPGHPDEEAVLTYTLQKGGENGRIDGDTLLVDNSDDFEIYCVATLKGAAPRTKVFTVSVQKCTCDDISFDLSGTTLYKERTDESVSHTFAPQITTTCDIAAHNDLPISYHYAFTGNQDGASLKDSTMTATKAGVFPIECTVSRNGFTAKKEVEVTVIACNCTLDSFTFADFTVDLTHEQSEIPLAAVAISAESCEIPTHQGQEPQVSYTLLGQANGASISGNVLTIDKTGLYPVKARAELNGDILETTAQITANKCICNTVEIGFPDLLVGLDDETGIASVTFTATMNNAISCAFTGHTNTTPESIAYRLLENPGDGVINGDTFTATIPGEYTVEAVLTLNGVANHKTGIVHVVSCACTIGDIETGDRTFDIPADTHTQSITLSANVQSLHTCPVPSHKGQDPIISYAFVGEHPHAELNGNVLTATEDGTYTVRVTVTLGLMSWHKDVTVTSKLLPLAPEISLGGYTVESWTDKPVTVTLTAANGGDIYYMVGGGEQQRYTAPITLDQDGKYILDAWTEKHGVKTETVHCGPIQIDQSAPKLPLINGVRESGWYNTLSPVSATIDPTSGSLETLYYQVGGEDWIEGNPTLEADGSYDLQYKVVDELGRESEIAACTVNLDMVAPIITGVEDGATYYVDMALYALDDNLAEIQTDELRPEPEPGEDSEGSGEPDSGIMTLADEAESGEPANRKLLPGNQVVDYTVTAVDKAGNSTTYMVSMREIPAIKDPIGGLTPDTVQPENKDEIQDIIDQIDDILENSPDITPEQKEELEEIKKECEEMLDRLTPPPYNGGGSKPNKDSASSIPDAASSIPDETSHEENNLKPPFPPGWNENGGDNGQNQNGGQGHNGSVNTNAAVDGNGPLDGNSSASDEHQISNDSDTGASDDNGESSLASDEESSEENDQSASQTDAAGSAGSHKGGFPPLNTILTGLGIAAGAAAIGFGGWWFFFVFLRHKKEEEKNGQSRAAD